MAAPLSSPVDGRAGQPSGQRVLSVSPSRMQADEREARMPMDSSPLVVREDDLPEEDLTDAGAFAAEPSQPSLDRFASELSAMIEVAATTADTLNKRLHEISEGEHRAAAASSQLQEQLRLGARMLKAFQTQIARVENTLGQQQAYEQQVAETQTKIEQCFTGIESCIDKTLESVAYRLAEQARVAVARFDEGIAARQVRLEELDGRIAQCAEGINGICEMVEHVQASVGEAVASNQSTLEQLQTAAKDTKSLLHKHDQARKSLAGDLQGLRDELKSMQQSGAEAQESMRDAVVQASRADTTLRARLVEFDSAAAEHDRLADAVAELRELLTRLQPWEKMLLGGSINVDGLPEPIARVAGELKQQISQDMNWLSQTMRDVAERVSNLASVAPVPPAATAELPAAPEVQVTVKKPLRLRTFNAGA